MTKTISFDGRTVIVTGAGSGLGRWYALELGKRGAAVVVNDLGTSIRGDGQSHSAADAVVDEIRAAGGKAAASYDSVATSAGGEAIIATALRAFGRVDAVINNAGTLRNASFESLTDEIIDAMIDVHLKGAFYVTRPAYRLMKAQRYGRIVFTASSVGVFGNETQTAYGAAKAGLIGLMQSLANEAVPHGVNVNVILPTGATRLAAAMDPESNQKNRCDIRHGARPHRQLYGSAFRCASGDLSRQRGLLAHARGVQRHDGLLLARVQRAHSRLARAAQRARKRGRPRVSLR